MSDDERDDDDGPQGPREDDVQLDEHGYPISLQTNMGGKFQAQMNPLQLKMEQQRKEKEEKAKREAKKAALASRAAAFGSVKDTEKDKKDAPEAESKGKAAGDANKVPDVAKPKLEGKVVDMMKSKYDTAAFRRGDRRCSR